jgi:ATP-dependent DNA helicase RecG
MQMNTVMEILGKIEAPLLFSSRESFRYVHLIKDLENSMDSFLSRLHRATTDMKVEFIKGTTIEDIIVQMKEIMKGFDSCSHEQKKERIQKTLRLLETIKAEISSCPPQAFEMKSDLILSEILSRPVQFVKGVGPKIALLLEKKGVKTIEDLLYFIPRRYEDRRSVKKIPSLIIGQKETIVGFVVQSGMKMYGKRRIHEVLINDDHGTLTAKWFKGNQSYLKKTFTIGQRVIMTGEVSRYLLGQEMIHPDFEILDKDHDGNDLIHFKRIVPVYSETEGLHQKNIRRIMMEVIEQYSKYILSPIPKYICVRRRLEDMDDAVRCIHFPGVNEDLESLNSMRSMAHIRLIYDEFFFFELGMALKRKGSLLEKGICFRTGDTMLQRFYTILPFQLTDSQKRVIKEIEEDMEKPFSMNRLLQGDVGCGKTVVAMAAMVTACENGYQAAIMAPTEILAEQHHSHIREWAECLGLKVAILTASRKPSEKRIIAEQLMRGDIHIVIGTHALIQEDIAFFKLGLAIVDEQHRFGVIQRAGLRKKGLNPDVLVMTATPIPRTLAMTVYGDLDISVIDEMPPGRRAVRTKVFHEHQRSRVYEIARQELIKENQVFVVYPLVEESESLDLKDATRMAEHLQKEIFPEYKIGLIHGRMNAKVRDDIMNAFLGKKINLLVATTVIEVGIDVPQASLMIIEHAERFGLSQLHQLRGRVGRGDIPSYCILMSHRVGSEDSKKRLRIMEKTHDGFKIAEEDLSIRGPGEFMGTRQSGLPDFRVANIIRDNWLLSNARTDAFALIDSDPILGMPEHQLLKKVLMRRWEGRLDLAKTG